jgi:hypothetical protein
VVKLQDHWRIDLEPIAGYDAVMDDLYGALGRFNFISALLEARLSPKQDEAPQAVVVTKVGVYMRDTYEFNGPQYLGHWNENGMGLNPGAIANQSLGTELDWRLPAWNPHLGWVTPINNSDFGAWRTANGMGGDLLLLSDASVHDVNIRLTL